MLPTLAGFANATTWIVDINNGPGTSYLQIKDALAAAQAGDVILVRSGSYLALNGGSAITKGVTIIGEGVVKVGTFGVNDIDVRFLPAGETFVAVNLQAYGWWFIQDAGCITIRECKSTRAMTVSACADVRIQAMSSTNGGVSVSGSRVEIVDCVLYGLPGDSGQSCNSWWPASSGSPALSASSNSVVHFVRSNARGGDGGFGPSPGNGGAGVAMSNSELWIDGSGSSTIQGGYGGLADYCVSWLDGNNGVGLFASGGRVIRSGVTLLPQSWPNGGSSAPPSAALVLQNGATDQVVTPDSPTLQFVNAPAAGTGGTFIVNAPPGSVVRLNLGREPQVLSTSGILVPNLLVKTQSIDLGVVPAQGFVTMRVGMWPHFALGDRFFSQAQVVIPSPFEVRRTATALVVVR
ncbi:MAG TPA: hypothetical protein VM509_02330 [Planctomycetota bacterium]|nr:hypothetical protein [Planctomycetota bacterium]